MRISPQAKNGDGSGITSSFRARAAVTIRWPQRRWWRASVWVAAGFVLLLALQALVLYYGWTQMRSVGEAFSSVVHETVPAERDAAAMAAAAQQRVLLLLRMLAEPDPFEREADAREFEAQGLRFRAARDRLRQLPLDAPERRLLADALVAAGAVSQLQVEAATLLVGGDDARARALIRERNLFDGQRELVERLALLQRHFVARAEESERDMRRRQQRAQELLLAVGCGAFVIGITLGVLVTRLAGRAESSLLEARTRAEEAAHADPLTGLLNRRGLERARRRWRAAARSGGRSTLLLIDLDRFKPVNDTAGHDAGDELLRQLAALMRSHVRPADAVVRLGGDEFAIVLNGLSADAAFEVAERIRRAIGDLVFDWNGQRFTVGASIGVCEFDPAVSDAQWAEVLACADQACYRAKSDGRNRTVLGK